MMMIFFYVNVPTQLKILAPWWFNSISLILLLFQTSDNWTSGECTNSTEHYIHFWNICKMQTVYRDQGLHSIYSLITTTDECWRYNGTVGNIPFNYQRNQIPLSLAFSRQVVLTDIFPVAALAATVGFRRPLCINHTKKAVKFKYIFKLYQYFLVEAFQDVLNILKGKIWHFKIKA
jgi:hypothetical protein